MKGSRTPLATARLVCAHDGIEAQLARILSSEPFAQSERSRKFLEFVVNETLEGRGGNIKETVVAVSVFHRSPSFDPQADSIVRVEARHLRARLREYYTTAGRADPVVIDIPKGGYVPVFAAREGTVEVLRRGRSRRLLAVTALAGALVVAGFLAFTLAGKPPVTSVAVLPVANLSGPGSDLLCRGMTEDLAAELTRMRELYVTSPRMTARQQAADVREIGRQLSVGAVLQSSLRREGGRLHFTAQLVNTGTGFNIWSESYDRDLANALAAESELVRLVADGVARGLGVDGAGSAARHTPPAEAVDLFWRARYLRRQGTQEAWTKAVEELEQAVRIDPRYAQAWSALASTQAARMFHAGAASGLLAAQTRFAASKTLELAPADPSALLALAQLEWIANRNWPAAERRFRLVVDRNPRFVAGHGWFATALMARGRFDEALVELSRASRLDPYAYLVSNDEATILYCARRYDQAVARARKTLALEPQFIYARIIIGACEAARGRYAEAIREFRPVLERSRGDVLGRLGHALARNGRPAEVEALLRELESEGAPGNSRVQAAFIHTGRGDFAGALDSLEAAFVRRETDLNYMAVEPVFTPLHGEPRFEALKKRMGL